MNKKAQLVIFVIMGLVLLLGFGVLYIVGKGALGGTEEKMLEMLQINNFYNFNR